jgi:hypothetical protein
VSRAEVSHYDARLFELDGFAAPSGAPDHVCFAPRVDVSVYSVERNSAR